MPLPADQIRECLAATGEFISKRRPPPEFRDQVDFRADIVAQTLTIACVRPSYLDQTKKADYPFARMQWVGTRKVWRLFWMKADLKWHSYTPLPESSSIATLLAEVDRDPQCCFFG